MADPQPKIDVQAELKKAYALEIKECARNFWYFTQFIITDDEENGTQRPFPLEFPHLHRTHQTAQTKDRIVVLKPRRMQISMYFCVRMLWRAMFCQPPDVYYGGYSAMDETLALYQLYRISGMYDRLPDFIKQAAPLIKNNALLKEFQGGGKIQGFPLKRIGEQGFGFTEYLFDEAAWQEAAATTYAGLIFSIGKGKIFIVSTPNGEEGTGQFFYNVWTYKNNRYTNYTHLELDSRENPEHDDSWHEERRIECGEPYIYAQMIEKSFLVPVGDPIFPEFDSINQVLKESQTIIEGTTLYICWDFGYHWPACVLMQRNTKDQWVVLREFCGRSIDFGLFCKFILEQVEPMYDRKKVLELHCIDPAGFQRYSQKAKSGANSDAHEVMIRWDRKNIDGSERVQIRGGAIQVGDKTKEGPRIKEMRRLMELREDNRFGILVDPQCEDVKNGFATGYVFDKFGKPVKNRYSHPMDAIQYGVTVYNRMVDPTLGSSRKKKGRPPGRINIRAGM